jgi:hypothetical protein
MIMMMVIADPQNRSSWIRLTFIHVIHHTPSQTSNGMSSSSHDPPDDTPPDGTPYGTPIQHVPNVIVLFIFLGVSIQHPSSDFTSY